MLDAAKANELLQDAKKSDGEFRKAIEILEIAQLIDFGNHSNDIYFSTGQGISYLHCRCGCLRRPV
jgi:hypothetical protein